MTHQLAQSATHRALALERTHLTLLTLLAHTIAPKASHTPFPLWCPPCTHYAQKLPSAPTVYARSDPKFTRIAILNSRPKRSGIYAQSEPAPVYFLVFYLASVSGFFLTFFLAFHQFFSRIISGINWHCRTRAFYLAYFWHSGTSFRIPFGILSCITSDNSCCHAIWHLFWNLFGHM